MRQLDLAGWQREAKNRDHCLSFDSTGREILVGLSREESEWLVRYERETAEALKAGSRVRRADRAQYLELHERHESARLTALHLATVMPAGNA